MEDTNKVLTCQQQELVQNSVDFSSQDIISYQLRRKSSMDFMIPYVGIDIGGTLAKVCLAFKKGILVDFKHIEHLKIESHSQFDVYFEVFPSNDIESMFKFIEEKELSNFTQKFHISGGGAHKYSELIEQRLNVKVVKVPEMQSLSYGIKLLDMLLPNNSVYMYDREQQQIQFVNQANWMFPLILVQIGSGVSILKFESKDKFERVSGTSLGGNMFLGIAHLLTGLNNFDEVLKITGTGENKNTDLFVKDIYKQIQAVPEDIQGDALCVSFGRVKKQLKEGKQVQTADLLKSTLQMVAFNVSQIAFLIARIHQVDNIFFTGYFIKNHTDTIECIEQAIAYFSKSQNCNKQAYFLKHDGFLGALGSFYVAFNKQNNENSNILNNNQNINQQNKEDEEEKQDGQV